MIADLAARLRSRYVPDHIDRRGARQTMDGQCDPRPPSCRSHHFHGGGDPEFPLLRETCPTRRGRSANSGSMVIGMTIVMLAGGIDLSVGSTFALANFTALALINVAKWPTEVAIVATVALGRAGRSDQRPADRLSAAAGVPDHACDVDAHARDRRLICCRSTRCGSPRAMWNPISGISSAPDRSWACRSVSSF